MSDQRDALDALRLPPTTAESPRPAFAAALRARLESLITPTPEGATMTTTQTRAELRTVTAYLCAHDARAAIEWYRDVFGATLHGDIIPMDNDRVGHCELWMGSSAVYLSDEYPEGGVFSPRTLGGAGVSFVIDVADSDATFALAVARGATALRPVADQFYGARVGWIEDPFGHRWSISTPLAATRETMADGDIPLIEASRGAATAEELWNEVGYFTIDVADLGRTRAFFNALFGWQLGAPSPDNPAYLHNPSTTIPMGFTTGAPERNPHLFFRVRDLESACARVEALGGTIVSRDTYASGGNAVVRDDQGYEFDLWEPAPGY